MRTFQIKAIALHIAEGLFFDPHVSLVSLASGSWAVQVGSQQPGIFLTRLPGGQEVDRIGILGGQQTSFVPQTLIRLPDQSLTWMARLSSNRRTRRVKLARHTFPGIFSAILLRCISRLSYKPTINQLKFRTRVTRSSGRSLCSIFRHVW